MNGKFITIFLLAFCLGSVVYAQSMHSSGFSVFFEAGTRLGLQPRINSTLTFTVVSGNLSGEASVYMHLLDGSFTYTADNVSTIRVNFDGIKDVMAQGDSGNGKRKIDDNTVLTVAKTNNVVISYNIGLYDPFDDFTDLGVGLFGFLCVGIGCFWGAYQIRRDEWFMNRMVGFAFALMFLIIGVGLIIGWLW